MKTERKSRRCEIGAFLCRPRKGFTTVVRCSSDTVLSEVLHLDVDEYALCGSRFVKVGCTICENWIGSGSNVQVLRGLCGGASSYLDVPGQWECKVYQEAAASVMPVRPLGRALPESRSSGPPTRTSGLGHVPLRKVSELVEFGPASQPKQ